MPEAAERTETDQLADDVIGLAQTYYKLTMVNAAKKSSTLIAWAGVWLKIASLWGLAVFFLGLAFAYWLGKKLNDPALGYLLTAALFVLLAVIVVLARKPIFNWIRNSIIRKIYE
ncbi:hypothetical protein HHL16_16530 [Pseudoflavitalea sp. G-6-1-2]|uniref:hypothetical protein n=1 Tax=Pseudoflavitalea sp. G-6-1-2 TaxID=2728841 RepID=UPI00146B3DDD|nr:hypothetical protein [Pseudoflavitalea sp. G-6-1-2]NML22491.1 hypothetical protein [Pseudoflavitalea sp. G-6-1-2]